MTDQPSLSDVLALLDEVEAEVRNVRSLVVSIADVRKEPTNGASPRGTTARHQCSAG